MKSIRRKIIEARKLKGLTQEELAENANVNLRTIQRIENNENIPRDKTLKLVAGVLQIDFKDLKSKKGHNKFDKIGESIINFLFLIIANFLIILIIGFLTLDSDANLNSRIGALLLSFLIPIFITIFTPRLNRFHRFLKYGSGLICYSIFIFLIHGLSGIRIEIRTGILLCTILFLSLLYYGDKILIITRRTMPNSGSSKLTGIKEKV